MGVAPWPTNRIFSPAQFVQVVDDQSDPQRVMFVHLYHPESYACGLLNAHLAQVAKQTPHVKVQTDLSPYC